MLVLHAGMAEGQLWLWGEAPAPANGEKRRGRAAKGSATSPFDAGAARLADALLEAASSLRLEPKDTETLHAWLPTVSGRPVPSSPLIADLPENGAAATLTPWTVAALPLSAGQAMDLLCACVGRETLAPGVIVGHTLAFWTTALRFAAALVARQQFLPGVEKQNGDFRACWEPVVSGADAPRQAALVRALPSAYRCLSRSAEAAPTDPGAAVLDAFLRLMADHLVRSALSPAGPVAVVTRRGRTRQPEFESLHDQWLHALRSADGTLHGETAELTRLAEQAREWRRPVTVTTATPFRLCFRLEEPPEENGTPAANGAWQVRYLLQAADDPSLLIPAAEAWNPKGSRAAILQRGGFKPREYLLSALGQASALSPRIEASLKAPAPGGYEMDAGAAHEFLTEKAWLLEQAGYNVFLPAWWTGKGTKLRLTARAHVRPPSMTGGGRLSLEEIVHFDWQAALGDEPLSLQELEALARLKQPLVRVRGQWVQVSPEEIEAVLAALKKQGKAKATVREVVRMALGMGEAPGGIPVRGIRAEGWVEELLSRLEGRTAFAELPSPAGFHGELRPYQKRGFSWLAFLQQWGLGACLADDMGLGKTIQALALIEHDWHEAANNRRPVLLVCPMSLVGNWQKEAERFTPDLPVLVHHGLKRRKGAAFRKEAEKRALVLCSYGLLHRDLDALKEVSWAGVVLDEAQNVKNPNTKQSQAARSLTAGYRIALTGTPVENHVGDLWSIMEFLNPGFLGTQADFKRRFFVPIQAGRDPEAAQRLQRLTGPFVLRRLKTDKAVVADLPDKLEMKVFCTLTKEQGSLYAAVVKEAEKSLDATEGIQRKGVVLATLSKLKQVCNHPAQFLGDGSAIAGRSGKLMRLTEMLEEVLAAGDRALLFTQFTEMGDLLQRHLQETFGREVLFLHGGTPRKQRDRMVERFQGEDGPRLFLLSLKAGGTGLNLTAANHVFHFDRWWNPAVEDQATDRAFRIGQRRNVQVHKFLCAGTVEEKIDQLIESKKEVAGRVVGTGEAWLTELSTAELKELFALRPEAVGE